MGEGCGILLHGASFTHERAPRALTWRKHGQGFNFGFIEKRSYKSIGGNVAHFMAASAYRKGVITVEQYHVRISGKKFSLFVREHFASMFKKSTNARRKLFLQDRDPSQNSVKARSTWNEPGTHKFTISARNSDLNPIENTFHINKQKFRQGALVRQTS